MRAGSRFLASEKKRQSTRTHRHSSQRRALGRRLRLEPLEERRLLSLAPVEGEFESNPITFNGGGDRTIDVSLSCSDYLFLSLDGSVERLTAGNLQTVGKGGSPELPQRLLRIALPADTDLQSVRLAITSTAQSLVPGLHDLAPAPLAYTDVPIEELEPGPAGMFDEDGFAESGAPYGAELLGASTEMVLANPDQNIVDGRDTDVYETDSFLDEDYCTLLGAQQMGR